MSFLAKQLPAHLLLCLTTAASGLFCNGASAFPISFPEQGAKKQVIQDEFKIADISVDPKTLKVGDEFTYQYKLPVRHPANVDFRSKNRGMPSFLISNIDDGNKQTPLPFPVQNQVTEHLVVYTVVSPPTGTEIVKWSIWGLETNFTDETEAFSLATGLSRVRAVKCADDS